MYMIKHKKNKVYYHSKISNNFNHYVFSDKQAHQFKNKTEANKILEKLNHPENFELIKI